MILIDNQEVLVLNPRCGSTWIAGVMLSQGLKTVELENIKNGMPSHSDIEDGKFWNQWDTIKDLPKWGITRHPVQKLRSAIQFYDLTSVDSVIRHIHENRNYVHFKPQHKYFFDKDEQVVKNFNLLDIQFPFKPANIEYKYVDMHYKNVSTEHLKITIEEVRELSETYYSEDYDAFGYERGKIR